ncbi:hypothetical protein BP6252_07146 [Coleophoma cylindrospora]|uniref:DUF7492 domain-containing protein n=1 Tax=Coleophoma cylindrospora TaxID=1849047 RepID=A0A3D8RGR4_9HELO|nr:hypothetical protein BP6252_07146 [Coleophoma cylindrospora]
MKSTLSLPAGLASFWLLACLPTIEAHSWVEQLMVIASNGTFVGSAGYPRGLVNRQAAGWNNDDMTFLVPPNGGSNAISATQAMCQYPTATQEAQRPRLSAAAGDRVALRYQENGHVTMPDLSGKKPANSGTVYVYGTTQPLATDKYTSIHNVWNTAGTGGDGRGVLLATKFFDDGQCYQANSASISQVRQKEFAHATTSLMGPDLWCQNDIQLPSNVTGTYTLYWVWDWPTLNADNTVAKNESYTTCMDVDISNVASSGSSKKAVSFAKGQDLNFAAVSSELGTQFNAPTGAFLGGAAKTGGANSISSTSAATKSKSGKPTAAAGNGVTVTVTASPVVQYITVTETETVTSNGAIETQQSNKNTATTMTTRVSSKSSTTPASSASTPNNSAAPPNVQPFMNAAGQISGASSSANATVATATAAAGPGVRKRHSHWHRLSIL